MSDAQLEKELLRFARHPLFAEIPPQLRGWTLEIEWYEPRLWLIEREPVPVALEDLRWHFHLPWWRDNEGRCFRTTPAQVIAEPDSSPVNAERIASSDLAFPIYVIARRGRLLVLDGIHRLAKAELLGSETIDAIVLTSGDIALFAVPTA